MQTIRLGLLIIVVLVGMASNSLLARAALGSYRIDPLSFTTTRLVSGAIMLLILSAANKKLPKLNPWMPVMLLIYAITFAYGYMQLDAATGTLLLFFAIQATMLGWEMHLGYRLSKQQWLGSGLTLLGLWLLLGNNSHVPSITGAMIMLCAGGAWAVYSILGRRSEDSLASSTANFFFAGLGSLIFYMAFSNSHVKLATPSGLVFAILSGAVTSALIYVLWFQLLKKISVTTSATLQMAIPVIVALSAAPMLNEPLNTSLISAGFVVLFGIMLVTTGNKNGNKK